MTVFVVQSSRTAQAAFGHRAYLGAPSHQRSAPPRKPCHQWAGPARQTPAIDRQAEAIAERDHERLRRDLRAHCERRPFSMDRNPT